MVQSFSGSELSYFPFFSERVVLACRIFKFPFGLKPVIKITPMDSAALDVDLERSSPNLFGTRVRYR